MDKTSEDTSKEPLREYEVKEDQTFEELGLDARLIRALLNKGVEKPTPIQQVAIPLILEGKDVVARAKIGYGKTFAYLLPLLQKLFTNNVQRKKLSPNAFILVPTRELCQQVYAEVSSFIELCRVQLKPVQLTGNMKASDLADLLLSYGYENDIKAFSAHVPRSCQCLLMSATSSADVDKLKKLILHKPFILTLPELGNQKDGNIHLNDKMSCRASDKLLYTLALLKLELVQKKVLIFINTIDMSFRLKLFLEKFGIKSAVLNAELPQNSRLHILEEFNAGLFDYLIATDGSYTKEKNEATKENNGELWRSKKHVKQKLDSEFGVEGNRLEKCIHGYVHGIGVLEEHTILVVLYLC